MISGSLSLKNLFWDKSLINKNTIKNKIAKYFERLRKSK